MSVNIEHSSLYNALGERNWDEARELLEREDYLPFIQYNDDVLHRACFEEAPIDIMKIIIHCLIDSSTEYQYPHQVLESPDSRGWTPLNLACHRGSNEMLEFLIESAPKAAFIESHGGWLPLHGIIWSKRDPTYFMKKLLTINPAAVRHADKDGHTPFHALFQKWTVYLEKLWEENNHDFGNVNIVDQDYKDIQSAKTSFLHLLRVFVFGTFQEHEEENEDGTEIPQQQQQQQNLKKWLPLHESAKFHEIPLIFLILITQTMPSEISRKDDNGDNLLYLILCKKHQNQGHLLMLLVFVLDTCLGISSETNNPNGKHLLVTAIRNGYKWNILRRILKAEPGLISRVDADSRLLPFMVALCNKEASLNVTYELIKFDPTFVSYAHFQNPDNVKRN